MSESTTVRQGGPPIRAEEMTAAQFATAVDRTRRAVLPVGSLEVHGTHAPIGFDTYTAGHIAAELACKADAVLFPPIWYTTCSVGYEARQWPGTLSIPAETQLGYLKAVMAEIARQGTDRLVCVNGHGPNGHLLELAAYDVWQSTGMAIGVLEWWSAARGAITEIKGFAYGNHADEIETSIFLATPQGHLANLEAATVNPLGPEIGPEERQMYLGHMRYTHTFDQRWIGSSGNFGDPTRATAAKGQKVVAVTVEGGCAMFDALSPYIRQDKLSRCRQEDAQA